MSFVTANLNQTITYWAAGTPDGFGGVAWGSPTTQNGRWEDKQREVLTPAGDTIISKTFVYLTTDVAIGGYLALGSSTAADPTTLDDAWVVQQFRKSPTIHAEDFERIAVL